MIICVTLDKSIQDFVTCFPVCEGSTNVVRTKVEIVLMRIVVTFGTHFFLLFHWPTTTLLKNLSKNSSTLGTFYPTKNVKTFDFYHLSFQRAWEVESEHSQYYNQHSEPENTKNHNIFLIHITWGQTKNLIIYFWLLRALQCV